jgi:hypothetical protein
VVVRDRHRSGGALRCVFILAEKVRNANDEGWKLEEYRKIPFIKNACNNFDEKKIGNNTKGHKLSLTEYKKLTS